eukprot:Filipodium_phascolosomae@DN8455_c0_g1_i1.p1
MNTSDNSKLGLGLTILGGCLGVLGVLLFFDRFLLAFSNVTFIAGICVILGAQRTIKFFLKPDKLKGTACCVGGFGLILFGLCSIGFVLQLYGLWRLFSAFLPNVVFSLKLIPGVKQVMELPALSWIVDWIYDQRRLPV